MFIKRLGKIILILIFFGVLVSIVSRQAARTRVLVSRGVGTSSIDILIDTGGATVSAEVINKLALMSGIQYMTVIDADN
jgi:hypothetical protein